MRPPSAAEDQRRRACPECGRKSASRRHPPTKSTTDIVLSKTQTSLTATDTNSNERQFAVYRSTGSGSFGRIAVLAPNSTGCTDVGLTPGSTYTFRVRAARSEGASAFTHDVGATTPAGP